MTSTAYWADGERRTQDQHARARARVRSNSLVTGFIMQPTHNNNNNNYYNNARARYNTQNTNFDVLEGAFYDVFGREMPRTVWEYLAGCIDAGAEVDLLAAIIEYTAGAPRPSWAYARAVIERQMAAGARTADDFRRGVDEWRATRTAGARQRDPARDYEQREYEPGQFDGLSADQMRELAKP